MLDNPPLLTIHRGHRRPAKALIEAFRGAQTSHLADAMEGRGALDYRIKPMDPDNAVFVGPALTALWNSTLIAIIAMLVATTIGTMAAIVAVRYRFRGKLAFQGLAGAPLAFPQLLLGIVLLLWFSVLGRWFGFNTGLVTAIIGHIVYIAPFAMVIVAVQVYNFDPTLEDAARDCGASTWEVYRHVTIPLLWPGIFSAAIFAFLLSWGNFYITYSLAGSTRTIPTFIFSGIAVGSSPLYPAIATVVFVPGILLVILANRLRLRAAQA